MHAASSTLLPRQARQVRLYLGQPLPRELGSIALPEELHRAVPRRQLQFRAGRYCAMRAMEALDRRFAGCQVRRGANGAPLWPETLTGSITHTDDFVSAAVARTTDTMALGIDTERIMSEPQARQVRDLLAWPHEVACASDAGMSPLEALTLVFSAKESIFKCLHPMTGQFFDFHDVLVDGVDGRAHTFAARLVRPLSQRLPARTQLLGRFQMEAPWVHTAMSLPSDHDGSNYHRALLDTTPEFT
jgi:enterobactin synthetase component D